MGAMLALSTLFRSKFVSNVAEAFISLISLIVFALLDVLDGILCLFFRFVDELLERESSSCYCFPSDELRRGDCVGDGDGEDQLSESLFGRRNLIKLLKLVRIPKFGGVKRGFRVGKGNRWSDCGCESCLSWMRNGDDDSRLHLVVNEPGKAMLENDSSNMTLQTVIFIHGFLSSSSVRKETLFPNLSEHTKQNYRLFAMDLLGFGRSPKPNNCLYTLRDHLEMIEKSVIRPYQVNSFHLVAHSMGCVIALALAAKYSTTVKSVTLIAPPYFSSRGDASSKALKTLAPRRVWPALIYGSAFMSWYEHLGRCMCFIICRNHRMWEWLLKLLNRRRELHFSITDMMQHTHHSAWHTMHNVICGGAKLQDKYLEAIGAAGVRIHVVHGTEDQLVPVECSFNLKMKASNVELELVPIADHNSVILGRERELTSELEKAWDSIQLAMNSKV